MILLFSSAVMTMICEIDSCLASSSPLILPFGLFYTIVKHSVDSYCLIAGVFKPTTVESRPFYLLVTNLFSFIGPNQYSGMPICLSFSRSSVLLLCYSIFAWTNHAQHCCPHPTTSDKPKVALQSDQEFANCP